MREQFIILANKLKQYQRFEITHYHIGPVIQEVTVFEMIAGTEFESVKFPEEDISMLSAINGFQLEWRFKNTDDLIPYEKGFKDELFGRIWLYDVFEIFGMNFTKEILPIFNLNKELHPLPYFPVDFFHPDYSGCTLLEMKNRIVDREVTIHLNPYGFYKSGITIQQYLEILLITAGLVGSLKGLMYPEGIESKLLRHYLPQVFPGRKIEDLNQILRIPI